MANPVTAESALALRAHNISKRYGATLALDDVHLHISHGEIHGLLGHNGSGKSTLIKVLAGVAAPDAGSLEVLGTRRKFPITSADARELGLRFVHQNLGLVPTLTVGENLLLHRFLVRSHRPIQWRQIHREASTVLEGFDVPIRSRVRIDSLNPTEQALVAIVRAIMPRTEDPPGAYRVLVLDEPTVFLPREQVGDLFAMLRRLVRAGDSVVLVSHRMDEVLGHTDRVTVLRDGRNAFEAAVADTTEQELIEAIVGRRTESTTHRPPTTVRSERTCLANRKPGHITGLTTRRLFDIELDLRPEEIIGLTGLVGSGHEQILYALFGCDSSASGRLELDGMTRDIARLSPAAAMEFGIGLIPADRSGQGIAGSLSLEENLTMTELGRYFSRGFLRPGRMLRDARQTLREFGVRPQDPSAPASQLSGGNQQRVVAAKWLQRAPKLLLLHEPTQGVDVGARAAIWAFVTEIANLGATVLCATTDHEELTTYADRVAIFGNGRLTALLSGSEINKERIAAETLTSTTMATMVVA